MPIRSEAPRLEIAMLYGGCCCSADLERCLPAGHALSRARVRHLRESVWMVASRVGVPVGFAAFKRADGQVRVVHELLLDPTLTHEDALTVTHQLLSTLEWVALDNGVTCLTFLVHNAVVVEPFESRGYMSLALDRKGVWLQRKLEWPGYVVHEGSSC
jgi:hypothetical protein